MLTERYVHVLHISGSTGEDDASEYLLREISRNLVPNVGYYLLYPTLNDVDES